MITLYYISSSPHKAYEVLYKEFGKKISVFQKFKLVELSGPKLPRRERNQKVEVESKLIIKKMADQATNILLDVQGSLFSTQEFTKKIVNLSSAKGGVGVFIGGAFGVSAEVKALADDLISLSKLTLNHQVALLVLLEQIYRALTIHNKIPYHN